MITSECDLVAQDIVVNIEECENHVFERFKNNNTLGLVSEEDKCELTKTFIKCGMFSLDCQKKGNQQPTQEDSFTISQIRNEISSDNFIHQLDPRNPVDHIWFNSFSQNHTISNEPEENIIDDIFCNSCLSIDNDNVSEEQTADSMFGSFGF